MRLVMIFYITQLRLAWVCYEWLVTLDQEIKHIWAQPWTLSTWIFVASRYATIIMAIIQVTPIWSYVVRTIARKSTDSQLPDSSKI